MSSAPRERPVDLAAQRIIFQCVAAAAPNGDERLQIAVGEGEEPSRLGGGRADQLEALKKAGTIDYYETRAREVVCYWRSLAPNKRVPLKLDLVAEWPGKYTGPASRAYLYYTAEQKHWAAPLAVEIAK